MVVVPCKRGAELAKMIIEYEMVAKEQTGWYLKVVEKGGDTLTDVLSLGQEGIAKEIHVYIVRTKQNCIYETWCMSCQEREAAKIDKEYKEDENKRKELKKRIKLFKYVGETSRSVYERSWEHVHSIQISVSGIGIIPGIGRTLKQS